jgi:hypothetical protein
VRRRALKVGLLSLLSGVAASIAIGGCDDPKVSSFPPASTFSEELTGHVFAGPQPVQGALVRVDPGTTLPSDVALNAILDRGSSVGAGGKVSGDIARFSRFSSTDSAGVYRFEFTPVSYDLSVRYGLDALVYRGLDVHFVDVPLPVELPPSGFHAILEPVVDPLPVAGHSVAFFVSGDDARASTTNADGVVDVTFARYESDVMVHAVEYETAGGLAAAVAESHAMLRVRSGEVLAPALPTTPVLDKLSIEYTSSPPPGFTFGDVEVRMDMGIRASSAEVGRLSPNVSSQIAIVTGARYFARATATRGGELSTSGFLPYDPHGGLIALPVPVPVPIEAPPGGDVSTGTELTVDLGKGVVEHAFVPVSGEGPTIRVITTDRVTTLPDVTVLGLPHPSGPYLWTVEHFATLSRIERFGGPDARWILPSWKSAPIAVTLQ